MPGTGDAGVWNARVPSWILDFRKDDSVHSATSQMLLVLAGSLLLAGCNPSSDTRDAAESSGAGTDSAQASPGEGVSGSATSQGSDPTIFRYSIAELNMKLGSYLPPLDEGRVEVAPPDKWYLEPRSKNYLTRFVRDRTHQSPLPRITVQVRPADFDDPADTTEEDLLELLDLLQNQLDSESAKGLIEQPAPMVIGTIGCIRHVVRKRFQIGKRVITADREVLQTLTQGRIYQLSLDAYRGRLADDRARLYAVLAGLNFSTPGEPSDKVESPGETSPAGESPATPDDSK